VSNSKLTWTTGTPPENILTMNTGTGEPVVIFHVDGNVSWKGRMIESDDEFKAAMIELLGYMRQSFGYKADIDAVAAE